jgi:hypothetical protein
MILRFLWPPGRLLLILMAALDAAIVSCLYPAVGWHYQRSDPDPELMAVVIDVGEWVLPPDATVIAGSLVDSLDNTYALTLAMRPASVDVLLRASRFTAPLQQGTVEFLRGADGGRLVPGPTVWPASEGVPRPPGEDRTDLRLVVVDRSDPHRSVVHLEVWT